MEFLINPNVSYVLLVFGFLTAILALFAPGTGLLELGALATLALAAYGIINLPVHLWALGIMAAAVIPFVIALLQPRKRRLPLILLSSLTFVVGSALLFRGEGFLPAVNIFLILLLSPLTIGLAWLMASKTMEAITTRPVFDLDKLVGMTGETSSDIRGEGTVYVNGEEWTAYSGAFIPARTPVRVTGRRGLALLVEPVNM